MTGSATPITSQRQIHDSVGIKIALVRIFYASCMSLLRVKYITRKRRTLSPAYVWILTVSPIMSVTCQHRHASEETYHCQTVNSNLGRYLSIHRRTAMNIHISGADVMATLSVTNFQSQYCIQKRSQKETIFENFPSLAHGTAVTSARLVLDDIVEHVKFLRRHHFAHYLCLCPLTGAL